MYVSKLHAIYTARYLYGTLSIRHAVVRLHGTRNYTLVCGNTALVASGKRLKQSTQAIIEFLTTLNTTIL
jgi:hypothetical protein